MTDTDATDVEALLEQVDALAADYGTEVAEAVRLGREHPLDADIARRLYTRILMILRGANNDDSAVAAEISAEVDTMVESVERPAADPPQVELADMYGLEVRDVVPTPTFNGQAVKMLEGYVRSDALHFWEENDRYVLHVQEFTEKNGREPTEDEILGILTGEIVLPSLGKDDPFKIKALAESVARKGVEKPPIIDKHGVLFDGHRRTAAARYVLSHADKFGSAAVGRAEWIKVWMAPTATPDQIEAIVVALNFEDDLKEPWPEYVKARRVASMYESKREKASGRFNQTRERDIKREIASHFAIRVQDVTRYLRMVRWAEDFEAYHTDEAGREAALVRYKADDIFQWFYELDAGTGDAKLTRKLDQDDALKAVVYDLMFEVLDSGAQVRNLHKVVADDTATNYLMKAHAHIDEPETAAQFVQDALEEARRKSSTITRSRAGFDGFLRTAIERLGGTPPDYWDAVDTDILKNLQRVLFSALGTINGQLASRGEAVESK